MKYTIQSESYFRQPFQQQGTLVTQLNTALSKCFNADVKGSKGIGLKKGGVYIERSVIDHLIQQFDYHLVGDYLFTYPKLIYLDDVTQYDAIGELYYLDDAMLREEAAEARHRSPWFKLGPTLDVTLKHLNYQLVEIAAYSPLEEFSLCWFDCFSGRASGISRSAPPGVRDEIEVLFKGLQPESPGYKIVQEALKDRLPVHDHFVKKDTFAYFLLKRILQAGNPNLIL